MTTSNRILIETFKGLLHEAHLDKSQPIQCDTCASVLDSFAELFVRGVDVPELMPLVQDHLDDCDSCRADFDILLKELETRPRHSSA